MFVVVGLAMFAWGIIVERAGRTLGTVLALLPVVLWYGFSVWAQSRGEFGEREAADHATALLVGLVCFNAGPVVTGPVAGWLRERRDPPAQERAK
ncbi:hypothetical protein [Microbacterium sp. NPDC089695]|uniref:hypothetical protein n=1 Tax=Microbacterium sp. NPDC089695 TaxID=3364198 RepID=UPI00382EC7DF